MTGRDADKIVDLVLKKIDPSSEIRPSDLVNQVRCEHPELLTTAIVESLWKLVDTGRLEFTDDLRVRSA